MQHDAFRNICDNLINNDSGCLLITSVDGKPATAVFWGYDKDRAYYIFGATDPELRNYGTGTKKFYDSFRFLNSKFGVKEIDFVGVNSPSRGGFKLSFGGSVVPYYIITKISP